MSDYLFTAIKAPNTDTPERRMREIIAIARRQCHSADGDSVTPAASICSTCPFTARTKRSKFGLSGRIHAPYAMAQFSTVTGLPAIRQAKTAFDAIVAAVTVSRNWIVSSCVKPIAALLWFKPWIESAGRCKRCGAHRAAQHGAPASAEAQAEKLKGGADQ